MTAIEDKFSAEFLAACETSRRALGIFPTRLVESATKDGAVKIARQLFSRRKPSDSFDALRKAGRLDLCLEAIATKSAFQALFSDEEVDWCLELLCECGYYGG